MTAAFTCGLLSQALGERINIVNAPMLAQERNVTITETLTSHSGEFTTMISVVVKTDKQELTAAGTIFGNQYLRLVRFDEFALDAYLDGYMLINRHIDAPGMIGSIGTTFGKYNVNIAHMALGRAKPEPGGDAVAILNLDNMPSAEALNEVKNNSHVKTVELIKLPAAGSSLPWLGL
jgi:D-3-phosphoglycerate dehydrogenase